MRAPSAALAVLGFLSLLTTSPASAQAPPPQPAAPYPAPYPYPPPGAQPYPAPYGQPPYASPSPYAPRPPPPPPQPAPSQYRSPGEMGYLYGVGVAYGAGTGIWIDALAGVHDPALALITPIAFGAAMPVGAYLWDANDELDRGVPSTIATGLLLGGVEGIAVSGLQWQLTGAVHGNSSQWRFPAWSSLTFVGASAGGVGGWAFGEWLHPDPHALVFIASGAGWGSLFGGLFGAGVASTWNTSPDGAAIGGFAGYNAGILASGLLSTIYTPSWVSLKSMWLGELVGTAVTTPIYLFYLGGGQAQHGLIANAIGGLAGVAVAGWLTASSSDPPGTSAGWTPPFQVSVAPTQGGAQLAAYGSW